MTNETDKLNKLDNLNRAEWLTNLPNGSLRNYKWMAEIFEFSLRNENLSYNHHVTVSSIKQIEIIEDKKLPQGRMQWANEPINSLRKIENNLLFLCFIK